MFVQPLAHPNPRRRRLPGVLTLAATASLAAGMIVGPSPASAKPKAPTSACKPGKVKHSGGKVYVCDSTGKWVHVEYLTAAPSIATNVIGQVAPTTPSPTPPVGQSTAVASVVAASQLADPSVDPAAGAADPGVVYKGKNPTGSATCEVAAGLTLNEGDVIVYTVNTYGPDGHIQNQVVTTERCGSDGHMHIVPALVANPAIAIAQGVQVGPAVVQQPSTTIASPTLAAAARPEAIR